MTKQEAKKLAIKYTAAQTLCLILVLALIIGPPIYSIFINNVIIFEVWLALLVIVGAFSLIYDLYQLNLRELQK